MKAEKVAAIIERAFPGIVVWVVTEGFGVSVVISGRKAGVCSLTLRMKYVDFQNQKAETVADAFVSVFE